MGQMRYVLSVERRSSFGLAAFWLVPAASANAAFSAAIAELAHRYAAPRFEPHITIFATQGASSLQREDWIEIAEATVEGVEPFAVHSRGFGHSDDVFKTMYLEVDENRELRELHRRIRSRLPDVYVLEPHLSLIYKAMPVAAREQICSELAAIELPSQWRSDAVTIVVPGASGWIRVPEWREIHRASLR